MSDPVVVAAFEARLALASEDYVDTLNVRPATLPDLHTTLERDFASLEALTIGRPTFWRETGTLTVVCAARAGTGTTDVEALAEEVRDLFHNYDLYAGSGGAATYLRVLTAGSPAVLDPDDGSFFQLRVPVQYQFDFYR
jgi:hypothetical protein